MARRPRRVPQIPVAPVKLDEAGEALSLLLDEIIGPHFEVELDAAVDEVVLRVRPSDVPAVSAVCKSDPRLAFDYLRCLSIVDYEEASGQFEINYHLYSLSLRHKMVLKARVPVDEPSLPSVIGVWSGADWYEREAHDLFGIEFEGHPNLVPLLLYDEFEGFPGRKSFPFHDYDEW